MVADHQGRGHQGAMSALMRLSITAVAAAAAVWRCSFRLLRLVLADRAAGRGADEAVMTGDMAGHAADRRALKAALDMLCC
jgi:hypothetical protein